MSEITWMTVVEVARYIGVSRAKVFQLVASGVLIKHSIPGTRIVRYRKDQVDAAFTVDTGENVA